MTGKPNSMRRERIRRGVGRAAVLILTLVVLKWIVYGFHGTPDLSVLSPDGTYVATVEDVSAGVVGGWCHVYLRRVRSVLPAGEIASGPWGAVSALRWQTPEMLEVVHDGRLDGTAPAWLGVRIRYAPPRSENSWKR